MPNALASQTSPYLRQHAKNPVDWLPWGPEALAAARARDVPLVVSIGYSSCHWCHVMEHESFEDPTVAALMNEEFVCVKVDREERPDVDALYMEAVQGMTGHGGWPLNVFLTPEQTPFYGGTYFPPEPRHGMPSWTQVLQAIAETWRENAAEIRAGGERIREQLSRAARMEPSSEPFDTGALDTAVATLRGSFDAVNGGFGGAPKFPQTPVLEFLLRHGEREMSLATLRAMARGGIHDQLGGGFHRYSVDASWTVPHFEKMLYDNALLARAYLHAHRLVDGDGIGEGGVGGGREDRAAHATARDAEFGGGHHASDSEFGRVCRATLDWALREMRGPEGGFYSALDADSEGVEGRYYVWRAGELKDLLGEDADAAIGWLGVTEQGNFVDPHHPEPGLNVLTDRSGDAQPEEMRGPPAIGRPDSIDRSDAATRERIRVRLLQDRADRTRPGLDDKRLTSWNALMIAALADAGSVLDEPRYLDAAEQCAEFILRELREPSTAGAAEPGRHEPTAPGGAGPGCLLRTYSEGRAHIGGYLEDYAFLLEALIVLFEATCEEHWLTEARALAEQTIERFADPERGGFFSTPADGEELIARRKELDDSPIPSGASSAALGLLRLAQITGEESYERHALGVLRLLHEIAPQHPSSFGHLLQALELHLSPAAALACAVPPARSAAAGSSQTPPA
jgi:uncharacterized protein YyaL (SSP411 family)